MFRSDLQVRNVRNVSKYIQYYVVTEKRIDVIFLRGQIWVESLIDSARDDYQHARGIFKLRKESFKLLELRTEPPGTHSLAHGSEEKSKCAMILSQ